MPLENNKWRVQRGDCLWNIANSVYKNGRRWTEIAAANGISQNGNPIIYPNQLLNLPGLTPNVNPNPPRPNPPIPINKSNILWFSLTAGTDREMQAIWEHNSQYSWYRWEQWDNNGHLWLIEENKNHQMAGAQKATIGTLRNNIGWNVCRFSVRPVDKDGNLVPNSSWSIMEYDFRNNPPLNPPNPFLDIDNKNKIHIIFDNIDQNINANEIEIDIYIDDKKKYRNVRIPINKELLHAEYIGDVDPGGSYTLRFRSVRGNALSGWSNFVGPQIALPTAPKNITRIEPKVFSEQMSKQYGVYLEWTAEKTAKQYVIEWTNNPDLFDVSQVSSMTTDEKDGAKATILNIELGHEYYFRVGSKNEKGQSNNWSEIKSIILGDKPAAPTTWSNTTSGIIGEDIKLYWVHNSIDGSIETYARLYITVIDASNPTASPMEYIKVIKNEKPEEDKNKTSVYVINTNDPEWANVQNGFIIKWKVETMGIMDAYGKPSIEREINVYSKPEVAIELLNQNGVSINEVNSFPFNISVLASPKTQIPLSYYIEIISNSNYITADDTGKRKNVSIGDKIYQQYYDPKITPWEFILEMLPNMVDLENNVNYTLSITVAMNSGLNAVNKINFDVHFTDSYYDVYGNVFFDKETFTVSIQPYCNEYYTNSDGSLVSKLSENCLLSVYRKEYDGSFKEIAHNIENTGKIFVSDPHPSLDYARYRIVARTKNTGAISYADVRSEKLNITSLIIQWGEEWHNFDTDDKGNGSIEPRWSGSLLNLPYNVDVTEQKKIDSTLIEYAGRKHPVSYYGTQVRESMNVNTTILKSDKNMIYQIRRLSSWNGNVYVREPNGIGYWSNVTVSYSLNHNTLVIPISFTFTRVEGGI